MSPRLHAPKNFPPTPDRNRRPLCGLFLTFFLALALPALGQAPFPCSGEVLIVQDANALLHEIDQSTSTWTFSSIGGRAGVEYNALGFRATDRMVYAVQLNPDGNTQLVRIDSTGTVFGLGRPAGLPDDLRLDAGDVTLDGDTLYVTLGDVTNHMLYAIDLTTPGFPQQPGYPLQITGDTGAVHDWALHPVSGLLFGGDKTDGEVAVLDPATGVRTDNPSSGTNGALPLPTGVSYGGAWFDASGNPFSPFNLFLYRNNGEIVEISLDQPWTLEETHTGPSSNRNDVAICRQNVLGAAKRMTASSTAAPATVTIDFAFENLSDSETVFDVAALDDLELTFGAHGTDWTFTSIASTPAVAANPAFDGHSNVSLIDSGVDLAPGTTLTIRVTLELLTFDALGPTGYFCNRVQVRGETADGTVYADQSTEGLSTDPNHDGNPAERDPACLDLAPRLPCSAFVIQGTNSQLFRVDPSPFSLVPIGGPTGREINAIGYRKADGMIYGLELSPSGNIGIVRIDGSGTVHELGRPAGLPSDVRFDAGDVSGDTMYITGHGQPLYELSLDTVPSLPAVIEVPVSAHSGVVNDWAFDPISGWLFGGDQTDGEVAFLNPGSGTRIDNPSFGLSSNVLALPRDSAYGAAWFGATGDPFEPFELMLYRNVGEVLEIGFAIHPFLDGSQATSAASRNDGAACRD